jgi:hypothetical protein
VYTYISFSDSILNGMKSEDPAVVVKATQRADLFLQNTEGKTTFNTDGLKVKTNKTIINKKAFESNPMQNDGMSPGKTAGIQIQLQYLSRTEYLFITDRQVEGPGKQGGIGNDDNLLDKNILKKLLDASKICPEVNAKKKLSICPRPVTRMQDKIIIQSVPFKVQTKNNHVLWYKNEIRSRSIPM